LALVKLKQNIMRKLIFATNNENKVAEIKTIIGERFTIVSLKEAGIEIEIPEPHGTLEANASEKSATIYHLTGEDCFSEDTGLETEALNGEPGVKSARYAGEARGSNENTQKLLLKLEGHENRRARFRTVISLLFKGKEQLFEGICDGFINYVPKGEKGFGYDSVFMPLGETRTFGEMDIKEKNFYSHRKKAIEKLALFLSQ
jgi:XTP/dITP diphosphohydrolase